MGAMMVVNSYCEGKIEMAAWGTEKRPIVVRVRTEETAGKVAEICDAYNWHYILGFELDEDMTDLKRALKDTLTPPNVYAPCPCGSGKKYKFCCAEKMKSFDIHQFMGEFVPRVSSPEVG